MSDRRAPVATYRLQLRPEVGFDDVATLAPYLARLGVSHVYLSPVLQAVPGSTHGYDVVDHSALDADLGGAEGFDRMTRALREHGLGVVVDVVPNHMALPVPETLNQAMWSVLERGPDSPYARWFDVDWSAAQPVLVPVLGRRIGEVLDAGELVIDRSGARPLLRYHDHVLPVRPGTEDLPLPDLLDAQHYRLAYWRVGDDELNYRRFFDIDTLAAIRVEDAQVFAESHALLVALVAEGKVDGLRIDHPDGLADPRTYLRRLHLATDGAWVVVEKVLEEDEQLPLDWRCAGTTGYDALRAVDGLFIDTAGLARLTHLHAELLPVPEPFDEVALSAKREVARRLLGAEVERLVAVVESVGDEDVQLRDHSPRALTDALVELLARMPVYRAYVCPGEDPPAESVAVLMAAAAAAAAYAPDLADEVGALRDLALGRFGRSARKDEFVVRFQQTTGPVMAKGVEDTAFYRWYPLVSLCEVGGDPTGSHVGVDAFHAWARRQQERWPHGMTTLSTHDTKRSEDLRLRLAVLSELPGEARRAFDAFRWAAERHAATPDVPSPQVAYLVWQNLVGAWPVRPERMADFVTKALREAKRETSWQSVDTAYEAAVQGWLAAALDDPVVLAPVAALVAVLEPFARSNTLSAKLVQLLMPGVPDVYQGCEAIDRSLVDPDNRRLVDFGAHAAWLDGGEGPDAEKVHLVATALRVRRERAECIGADATYTRLSARGPAAEHMVAFGRGADVVVVATRLPARLARRGGWDDTLLQLRGAWREELSGSTWGGDVRLADLLTGLPVALLTRLP